MVFSNSGECDVFGMTERNSESAVRVQGPFCA